MASAQQKEQGLVLLPSSQHTSSTSNPYSAGFGQHLEDHGIYTHGYEDEDGQRPEKPRNWADINDLFSQRRPSLSSSTFGEEQFQNFERADAHLTCEQLVNSVVQIIEGGVINPKCAGGGYPFTNLSPLTDGSIEHAQPDRFYGAHTKQLDKRIRDELSGSIIPSTQGNRPILPNFFLEMKGPEASAAVAKRQACYDGALGARAMGSLQSHGKIEPVYDSNAYTIATTYCDGQLKMYTIHPAKPATPRDNPEYVMTQLKSWSMTSDPKTFRKAATWYRNARDWAKDKRDEFIRVTNASGENAQRISGSDPAVNAESNPPESDADTADLVGDEVEKSSSDAEK